MIAEPTSKGERTRQMIRDTAYTLILEQGFAATSMRQIADRAGLALSSIYNHFSSKEAIFEAIVLHYHPIHRIIPLLSTTPGDTLTEFIHNTANRMVDELRAQPEFMNLILIEFVEFKGRHAPLLIAQVYPQLAAAITHLARFQEETRQIPATVLIQTFFTFFIAYYFSRSILDPALPADLKSESFDGFADIFLNGILKPDA